jgi:hypothetical protein
MKTAGIASHFKSPCLNPQGRTSVLPRRIARVASGAQPEIRCEHSQHIPAVYPVRGRAPALHWVLLRQLSLVRNTVLPETESFWYLGRMGWFLVRVDRPGLLAGDPRLQALHREGRSARKVVCADFCRRGL